MANAVYPLYKQNLLAGTSGYDLDNDNSTDGPFCALVDTGTYTYNAAHDFYNDLSGVVGTDQRITGPTVTNGTFDGSDLTYTAVTGNSVEALVIYRHNSGANSTWPLVLYEDTGVTGLPVTPNGGNIVVTWNASGIFTISSQYVKQDLVQVGRIGPVGMYEYSYIWDDPAHRQQGFLAHEVKNYIPEAVRAFADGIERVCYQRAIEGLQVLLRGR